MLTLIHNVNPVVICTGSIHQLVLPNHTGFFLQKQNCDHILWVKFIPFSVVMYSTAIEISAQQMFIKKVSSILNEKNI